MLRSLRTALSCAVALALVAVAAGPAHASSRQVTIMQDDALLFRSGAAVRDRTLDEMAALGAGRDQGAAVLERGVAAGPAQAGGVRLRRPGELRLERLRRPGAGDRGARDEALPQSSATAPRTGRCARGRRPRGTGSTGRAPRSSGSSPEAAGRHFDGSVGGVPRVNLWAIWNEPNLTGWLCAAALVQGGAARRRPSTASLYLGGHQRASPRRGTAATRSCSAS